MADDKTDTVKAPVWDVTNRGPMQSLGNFTKKGDQVARSGLVRKQARKYNKRASSIVEEQTTQLENDDYNLLMIEPKYIYRSKR